MLMPRSTTRLSLLMGDQTTTIERTTDLTMFEMLELFQSLALAAGYQVDSWKQAIEDMADMYRMDDAPPTDLED